MQYLTTEKDRLKTAIMDTAKNCCELIDRLDTPPQVLYEVKKDGVSVKITAEII